MSAKMSRQEFVRWSGAVVAGLPLGVGLPARVAAAAPAGQPTGGGADAVAAAGRTGISWPHHQALPHFAPARHLLVSDLEAASRDEQITFATLQGIVNRTLPRIFLMQPGDEGKETWLTDGLGVTYTKVETLWDILEAFRHVPTGIVVYDTEVPDTINAATSLAGLRDALAVSPQLADALAAGGYDYPVLEDLRGRFSSRLDVYRWVHANLWPETTHRMIVGLNPAGQRTGSAYLRDYPVANRAAVVWLDASVAEERDLLRSMFADMPANSPYLGWFPPGEFSATQLCSENSVYVLAADWFANMSVWSGTRAAQVTRSGAPTRTLDNKIYVTFTMSEGDNLQYIERAMRRIWGDPARGSVPLNWGISPLLLDAAPAMLHYYQSTASPHDTFVAGPSGAGYINPTPWPDATFRSYTRQTGAYMERAGLESVYILNRVDGTSVWMSPEETAAYIRDVDPSGVMFGWEPCTDTRMLDGTLPQSVVRLNNTLDELRASIAEAADGWDGTSPLFLSMGVLAMRMTPSDVAAAAATLGPEYEVVRADEYFDLIRQADRRHPIDDDGVPDFEHVVPGTDITATATSFLDGYEPVNAVDGDANTLWHAATGPDHPLPQALTLDLGAGYPVAALVYQPRQDVSCNGNITGYAVSVSTDGEAFTQVAAGTWRYDHHRKFTTWTPTTARFVRLEALAGFRGLASAAEITVAYQPDSAPDSERASDARRGKAG